MENKLPPLPTLEPGEIGNVHNAVLFASESEEVSLQEVYPLLDPEALILAIVSNKTVQDATGLDRQGLLRRFSASWSAESAFRECEFCIRFVIVSHTPHTFVQPLTRHRPIATCVVPMLLHL